MKGFFALLLALQCSVQVDWARLTRSYPVREHMQRQTRCL